MQTYRDRSAIPRKRQPTSPPRGARLRSWLPATMLLMSGFGPALSSTPLPFAEALRLAEQRSPQIMAADHAIASARERAVSGAQLPDPVLRAGVDNLPVAGADRFSLGRDFMTMRRIGVMQEFTGTEKRRLRRERGDRIVDRERAVRNAALAVLRREVASAWLDRAYAQQASSLLDTLRAELLLETQTLEASVRSGRASASDVRAAQVALVQAEDQLAASRQQERVAVRMLERWLGEDAVRPIGDLPDTDTLAVGNPEAMTALAHHAEVAVAREDEAVAASEARLAERARIPDWTIEVAYQQRGSGFGDMMSFGVSVPLPMFAAERQNRDILASHAALARAQASREDLERLHRAELRAFVEEWQGYGERLATLDSRLLPYARDRVTLALAAYRSGSGTLQQTLEARRSEVEARLQVLGLRRERARVWARLNFLGIAPEPSLTARPEASR